MPGDLTPLRGASLEPMYGPRLKRHDRRLVKEAVSDGIKVAGIGYVTGKAMQEVAKLDDLRNFLAAGDPALNTALLKLEVGAVTRMCEIQDGTYAGD